MVSWIIKKTNKRDDHDTLSVKSGSSSFSSSSSSFSSFSRKWCMLKNSLQRKSKTFKNLSAGDRSTGKKFYKFQKILLNKNMLNAVKDNSLTENVMIKQENTDNINVVEYDYNNGGDDTNNNNWINIYRYIYLNCYYYYKENWLRSVIILIVIAIISGYLIQNLIKLFEQLRITIISFYKWKILSSFIIPHGNGNSNNSNNNIIGSGSSIIMSTISWINFIKNVFSLT